MLIKFEQDLGFAKSFRMCQPKETPAAAAQPINGSELKDVWSDLVKNWKDPEWRNTTERLPSQNQSYVRWFLPWAFKEVGEAGKQRLLQEDFSKKTDGELRMSLRDELLKQSDDDVAIAAVQLMSVVRKDGSDRQLGNKMVDEAIEILTRSVKRRECAMELGESDRPQKCTRSGGSWPLSTTGCAEEIVCGSSPRTVRSGATLVATTPTGLLTGTE